MEFISSWVQGIIVAVITNIYMIFPAYMYLYGMNWQSIIDICSAVNPLIKDVPTMIAFSIVPFNIVSRFITSFLTVLLYKKISVPLKKLIN